MISANLAYINNVILGAIFQSPTCWHFTTTDTVNKFIGKFKGHRHRKIDYLCFAGERSKPEPELAKGRGRYWKSSVPEPELIRIELE